MDPEALVTDEGPRPDTPTASKQRLASGGLAALVADALARRPDIDFTPTMLSNLLGGRSAGAIANVLEKMRDSGTATRTCDKPKRYKHTVAPLAPMP
jgi:hypothetical protein